MQLDLSWDLELKKSMSSSLVKIILMAKYELKGINSLHAG